MIHDSCIYIITLIITKILNPNKTRDCLRKHFVIVFHHDLKRKSVPAKVQFRMHRLDYVRVYIVLEYGYYCCTLQRSYKEEITGI